MENINLIGYHGTTNYFAEKIVKEHQFHLSVKNIEWLGKGVYFWQNKKDGIWWAKQSLKKYSKENKCHVNAVVLKCQLICIPEEYVDLGLDSNMKRLIDFIKQYEFEQNKFGKKKPNFKTADEQRCFYCTLFKKYNNIKILSFPFARSWENYAGFKIVKTNVQICVTDNKCIKILSKL